MFCITYFLALLSTVELPITHSLFYSLVSSDWLEVTHPCAQHQTPGWQYCSFQRGSYPLLTLYCICLFPHRLIRSWCMCPTSKFWSTAIQNELWNSWMTVLFFLKWNYPLLTLYFICLFPHRLIGSYAPMCPTSKFWSIAIRNGLWKSWMTALSSLEWNCPLLAPSIPSSPSSSSTVSRELFVST